MTAAIKRPTESLPSKSQQELIDKANWVRTKTLEIHKLAPETRVASSLSPVEIFTALYYGGIVRFDSQKPHWDGRDRVVISKGHGSLCMYPILADLGFFDMSELQNVCMKGSFLGGIPDPIIPGFETVNGSLGHGVGVGCGVAVALKAQKKTNHVFVVTGDGELHEGSVWEGFMFAAHHKIDNFNVIVDHNKKCMLGMTKDILDLSSLKEKFTAFGFQVEVVDGHDVVATQRSIETMAARKESKPKVLIAETIKGKGAPTLEANPMCHVTGLKSIEVEELLSKRGKWKS